MNAVLQTAFCIERASYMTNIYELRLYDDTLLTFRMESDSAYAHCAICRRLQNLLPKPC
jgi:hypothetical protein